MDNGDVGYVIFRIYTSQSEAENPPTYYEKTFTDFSNIDLYRNLWTKESTGEDVWLYDIFQDSGYTITKYELFYTRNREENFKVLLQNDTQYMYYNNTNIILKNGTFDFNPNFGIIHNNVFYKNGDTLYLETIFDKNFTLNGLITEELDDTKATWPQLSMQNDNTSFLMTYVPDDPNNPNTPKSNNILKFSYTFDNDVDVDGLVVGDGLIISANTKLIQSVNTKYQFDSNYTPKFGNTLQIKNANDENLNIIIDNDLPKIKSILFTNLENSALTGTMTAPLTLAANSFYLDDYYKDMKIRIDYGTGYTDTYYTIASMMKVKVITVNETGTMTAPLTAVLTNNSYNFYNCRTLTITGGTGAGTSVTITNTIVLQM